jgi:formylglycine-generating enzyme
LKPKASGLGAARGPIGSNAGCGTRPLSRAVLRCLVVQGLAALAMSCNVVIDVGDLAYDLPVGMVEYDDGGGARLFVDPIEVRVRDYADWLAGAPDTARGGSCSWNSTFVPGDARPNGPAGQEDCPKNLFDWAWAQAQTPDQPVSCVDWCDASAYCADQGKRLCGGVGGVTIPIEYDAETTLHVNPQPKTSAWYLACSRGGERKYPYGAAYDADACNGESGLLRDARPSGGCEGGYPGLFDMSGNIEEWEDACDSTAPDAACMRRGGGYYTGQIYDETWLGCGFLIAASRKAMASSIGFRCCWEP